MKYQLVVSGSFNVHHPCNPFKVFAGSSRDRLIDLLLQLHHGSSVPYSGPAREKDLELLLQAELIKKQEGQLFPSFPVILNEDLGYLPGLAREIARGLFVPIRELFPEIQATLEQLQPGPLSSREALAFIVIGSFILDRGRWIIDRELKSLAPPPSRRPGGDYFFQLIASGRPEPGGRFRERGETLGSYFCGVFGTQAAAKEGRCLPFALFPLMKAGGPRSGKKLGLELVQIYQDYYHGGAQPSEEICSRLEEFLLLDSGKNPSIPFFPRQEWTLLEDLLQRVGPRIGSHFRQYYSSILNTFYHLPASRYASFLEFFDWFYYLIVEGCLDLLAQKGYMTVPPTGYQPYILENFCSTPQPG